MTRRYWTLKEEEAFFTLLEGLVTEGWHYDDTFQGDYMNRLETEINEKLPGCCLNKKHIHSKLTVWKKTHYAILGMLASNGATGFIMDPTLNIMIEDRQDAWAVYGMVCVSSSVGTIYLLVGFVISMLRLILFCSIPRL